MYAAVNAWTFPKLTPVEQIEAARSAGFEGLELVVGPDEPLRPDTPPRELVRLAERAAEQGVRLTSLATAQFWDCNYASPEPAARQQAEDLTRRLLDLAAAARVGAILVVPAVVGKAGDARPSVPYADALARTLEALQRLRFDAEAREVAIAVENVWNRFLLSPVEAADLLDQVNSPCVRFYFDTGNVLAYGYPEDWIRTLGYRIARVHAKDYDVRKAGWAGFCPLGEGSVDWPSTLAALRAAGYDGPLTYEGGGDPADAARRLRRILEPAEASACGGGVDGPRR